MADIVDMEKIKSLCKRRGFIFPSSEVYGGLESTWDYGPLGVELKNNVKRAWWKSVVYDRDDMEGLDAAILMNRLVWKYSGHEATFSDPLVDCKECKARFRSDHLLEKQLLGSEAADAATTSRALMKVWEQDKSEMRAILDYFMAREATAGRNHRTDAELIAALQQNPEYLPEIQDAHVKQRMRLHERYFGLLNTDGLLACPKCGATKSFTQPRRFNLMFRTFMGPLEDDAALVYLRPETAQGIFVNFVNVQQTMRRKLPFGIAQIGKAFRNEITPGNFTFRTREFEQMEIEYFVREGEDESCFERWVEDRLNWYIGLGIRSENLRKREQDKDELAHYAKRTIDIEYLFPMGWSELEGIANRGNYDLTQHSKSSMNDGVRINPDSVADLTYFDEEQKKHITPYVIEPSAGADRGTLAFLFDAYAEEEVKGETRVVLRLHNDLAPIKAAVFPLKRNEPRIVEMARRLRKGLQRHLRAVYDDTGAIGKLYRRQDEIGTPFCVTVDFQSLEDQSVTVRDRDTMQQVRIPSDQLGKYLSERLAESSGEPEAAPPITTAEIG